MSWVTSFPSVLPPPSPLPPPHATRGISERRAQNSRMPGLYVAFQLLPISGMPVVHDMRVLVAAAGLSGLCAARELAAAGCAVTLLDARDRLGGRVRTLRDDLPEGAHAELGGEFIDAEHREIRALADGFGLPLVRVLSNGFTHRFHDDAGQPRVSRS